MKEYKWVSWEDREWSVTSGLKERGELGAVGWKIHKIVWKDKDGEVLKGIVYFKKIPWYKAIAIFFKGKK